MISLPLFLHRAQYDAEGNIILPPERSTAPPIASDRGVETDDASKSAFQPIMEEVQVKLTKLSGFTKDVLDEGREQYAVSIQGGGTAGRSAVADARRSLRTLWNFLKQPVWIPSIRGSEPTLRGHSRAGLFVIDVVRFGATFAGIFFVLFTVLNYESFYQIASARITSIISPLRTSSGETEQSALEEKLRNPAASAITERGDSLLGNLPPVGPPGQWLLVPKLSLTVPIVQPRPDALLREDWAQVEKDIQTSLQDGVVHYPGTARPGQAGNFFITGHSSYFAWDKGDYKSVFARLNELNVGDEYWVYYGGDKHRYVISRKREVSPRDISVLDQPTNQRLSTLMTCWPIGTTLARLTIQAKEVDLVSGLALEVGEHTERVATKVRAEALPI